ncbi:hypothetical protein [Bacillus sp. FJAT-52991]|uniref:Uncharacterized protein n=1 Tax=Bacillus kandeliae TaxID=3129297 RepID=A0ABZ2N337_9BACI
MKNLLSYSLTAFICLFLMSHTAVAESLKMESNRGPLQMKEEADQGKVVFEFKTDFVSMAKFFKLNVKEFHQLRDKKSMVEIAQMQGINRNELFNYLVTQHYKHLELAYQKKQIDLEFIMDYTLHLKEDIIWEMHVKK